MGVEARHKVLNIIVQSTSHNSQHQNKLAAIELIKKEIANKSWDSWFKSEPSSDFPERDQHHQSERDDID